MKFCLLFSSWGAFPCFVLVFFLFSFLSFLSTQTFIVEYLVEYSTLKVWFQYFSIIHMHRHTIFYLRQDLIVLLVVKIVGATRFSNVHKEANDIARKSPPQI